MNRFEIFRQKFLVGYGKAKLFFEESYDFQNTQANR